jgi:hypothetical protein
MSFFDSDAAAKRAGNMWRKLGGLYEKAAYAWIEKGFPDSALKCARMADVCFWQATGEGSPVEMKHVIPTTQD